MCADVLELGKMNTVLGVLIGAALYIIPFNPHNFPTREA